MDLRNLIMGEMADLHADYGAFCDDRACPEDYLDMSDDELRKETSRSRNLKIMSIRKSSNELSEKQRWCLAKWIADKDNEYESL